MTTDDKHIANLSGHKNAEEPKLKVLLPRFREELSNRESRENFKQSMIIEQEGRLSVCYGAFEYINQGAKVILVGLTPGEQQARRANESVAEHLANGQTEFEALKAAKIFASFSGPMRPNLVLLLDEIGLARKLGISSTEKLFGERSDLCHFTSTLRFPVFVDGQNYSGTPSVLSHPVLKKMVDDYLAPELSEFRGAAWYVPLGKEAALALRYLSDKGVIPEERVLNGLPHPSGANAERIAYFLGKKQKESLSAKTNPETLDAAKRQLLLKMGEEETMEIQTKDSRSTATLSKAHKTASSEIRDSQGSAPATTIPSKLENQISGIAEKMGFTVVPGTATRHEIEIQFKANGRAESLYINRKSFWRKDLLKVTMRPGLSENTSSQILGAKCASRLLQKGAQMESYSSNFRAFNNRQFAKGSKNEHFGHAWTVPIDDRLSSLKTFFETLIRVPL